MFFGRRPLSTTPLAAQSLGAGRAHLPILYRMRDRSGPALVAVTAYDDRPVRDRSGPDTVVTPVHPFDLLMTELDQ